MSPSPASTRYRVIIQGCLAAVDRDLGFEIINLGESNTITLDGLISLIEQSVGKKAILDRLPFQPGDMPKTCANISKAQDLVNYKPTTPIEDSVKTFVA